MTRRIRKIEPISEEDLADPDLQRSRHRGMAEWDRAIIGTASRRHGRRVFVYDDEALIDLVAEELRASGGYDDDDERDLYDAATEAVAADDLDPNLYGRGAYRPYVLTEAPEDPESYEEAETLFRLGETLYH